MVRGDLLKISVHAKSHNTTYRTVNQEDTIDVTLSGTNVPYNALKIKGRENDKTKNSSPCRRNRMLRAINLRQDGSLYGSTRMKPPFLSFNEPNLCNDYIFMDLEYSDRFCHHFFNQVDSNTDLLDNVLLKKVDVRPTKKPRSISLHKLKSERTTNKKKSHLKDKRFRSVSKQLHRRSSEPSSNEKNSLQQRLFYTNEDLKNYLFNNAGTPIAIVTQ